jgi:hypothetical protein
MTHNLTFTVQRTVLDAYSVELTDEQYRELIKKLAWEGLEHEGPEEHIENTFYTLIPELLGKEWDETYEEDRYEHTEDESLLDSDGGLIYGNDDFELFFNDAQQFEGLENNDPEVKESVQ